MLIKLKSPKDYDAMRFWIYGIYIVVLLVVVGAMTKASAETIEQTITRTALSEGVDPKLAVAIAKVESSLNPNAIGSLGEIGLFQLRPEYHVVKRGHIEGNVRVAVRYLAQLKRQCARYGDAYFVCFNYGPTRQLKSPHTFPYYVRVMNQMKKERDAARYIAGTN